MGQADIHDDVLDSLQGIPPEHAAATLAMVLGTIIGIEASKLGDGPLLLAGGSMHHVALVQTIKEASPRPVEMYPNAPAREAAAMVTLGLLELDGVAPSLVQVTGRSPGPMPGSLWMRPML